MAAPPRPTAHRVVLYVRVSALMGRGGEDFHSPDVQLDTMRRSVRTAGLREVATVSDIDVSGKTFSRDGIEQIRDLVNGRQIDVVAVYDLSRLGRNLAESLAFIRWLRDRNVSVMSAQEKIDDSPEGQYMLGTFLGLAELYGAQIGRRWAQIIERRARMGKGHGNVAQGYVRIDGHLEVDPVLGPPVAALFTAYAAGDPVGDIAADFGVARGRAIAKSRVKAMLRNPTYRGRVIINSKTGGPLNLPAAHEPLVDEVTWHRVQQRMARDATTPPRHLAPAHSLTGIPRCAHCGKHLQVTRTVEHGKDNPTRRLLCHQAREARNCHGIGEPRYDKVEEIVLDAVRRYAVQLASDAAVEGRRRLQATRAGADRQAIEREIARTRDAMARLTERWARGGVPDAAYDTTLERLRTAEAAGIARLEMLRDALDAPAPATVIGLCDEMFQMWPDMLPSERNQALKAVLRSFTVRKAAFWREQEDARVADFEFRWPYDHNE